MRNKESDDDDGLNRTAPHGGRNGAENTTQIPSAVHIYSLTRAAFSWECEHLFLYLKDAPLQPPS